MTFPQWVPVRRRAFRTTRPEALLPLREARRRCATLAGRPRGGRADGEEAAAPWPRRKGRGKEAKAGGDDAAVHLDRLLVRVGRARSRNCKKTTHSTVHDGADDRTGTRGCGPRCS